MEFIDLQHELRFINLNLIIIYAIIFYVLRVLGMWRNW